VKSSLFRVKKDELAARAGRRTSLGLTGSESWRSPSGNDLLGSVDA